MYQLIEVIGVPKWLYQKIWLIMRLTTVLLIACLMQVSAAGLAQKITLNERNAPLNAVLKAIGKQSGFAVLFDGKSSLKNKKVTVAVKEASVEEALNEVFRGLDFTYKIEDKTIAVKVKDAASFVEKIMERFQAIDVKGKVVDEKGVPLVGATVKVKGTDKSTTTDANGDFFLQNVDEDATISISYLGYKVVERTAGKEMGTIQLEISSNDLQEVMVNKGYYTTKQELNTGSVSTIAAEAIGRQPIANPLLGLHGQVPGLFVAQDVGTPGASVRVNIRGLNSIANGRDPFYIVDGVPFSATPLMSNTMLTTISPFSTINPADIERIEILKDADATAIYGSRGANGVILITTKKGATGKAGFKVNTYTGIGRVTRMLDLLNTDEYLMMREEAIKNDNATPQSYDFDVNGIWSRSAYTDWQKRMIGGTAKINNTNATFTGGSGQFSYLLGAGFRNETTVYPGDYRNINASINTNIGYTSINRKIRVNYSGSFFNNDITLPLEDMTQFALLPPNTPDIYKANGELNWENFVYPNPYGILQRKSQSVTQNILSNLDASFDLPFDLTFKTTLGFNQLQGDDERRIPFASYDPTTSDPASNRFYYLAAKKCRSFIIEPQLSYSASFRKHRIDALVATTIQQTTQNGSIVSSYGYSQDALIGNLAAATTIKATSSDADYKYNAVFGRIGYSFDDRYSLNLTGRRDGSSRFGPGRQFGNFGAIGAAWIFSHESFLRDSKWLSFGKLRASIGRTGNDQLGDYQYLSTYSAQYIYLGASGLAPTQHTNPNYGWETINKMELGLELGFWDNRLSFTASVYRHRTDNQLVSFPTPIVTGFTSVKANLPAIVENKGIELELASVNVKSNRFSWITRANLTIPRNKLVSFPGIEKTSYATQYAIGHPLNVYYLYTYTGIDQTTGLYTFKDYDGNGELSFNRDSRPVFVGQHFFGGVTNSFNWGSWSLDAVFQFVKQRGSNYDINGSPGIFFLGNQPRAVLNRWQSADQRGDGEIQRFSQDYGDAYLASDYFSRSDARIVDASFVRLKTLMLAFQFPKKWRSAAKLSDAKIYFQGQNLVTITNYSGLDPENAIGVVQGPPALAPLKVFSLGLQLTF